MFGPPWKLGVVMLWTSGLAFMSGDVPTGQALLNQIATIPLASVNGRIDHLAFDGKNERLFVAALGNNTVEVVDVTRNALVKSVPGFHEPQGIAVVPDLNAFAVANGGTGTLQLLSADALQVRWTTMIGGDADNVRYDAARKQLFVAAEGGLSVVDPSSGKVTQRLAIAGHPESFQLDPAGTLVIANLPGASQVVVADRQRGVVTARWPGGSCGANYPMAIEGATQRVFVGCRRPASLAMLDMTTGRSLGSLAVVGDTDDLFYDTVRHRLYVIGGEGFVDVVSRDGDTLRLAAHVATRSGARTGLWVGDRNRLYIAVPNRSGQPAEIRVFAAGT